MTKTIDDIREDMAKAISNASGRNIRNEETRDEWASRLSTDALAYLSTIGLTESALAAMANGEAAIIPADTPIRMEGLDCDSRGDVGGAGR